MSPKVLDFVNLMAILVLSTACHEFAHARTADRFGDETPRMAGRISYNPLAHIDPFFTVILPAVMFWTTGGFIAAAWTPVSPWRMRNPRVHGLLTALAGPATNFVLAAAAFLLFAALAVAAGRLDPDPARHEGAFRFLLLAVKVNVFLGIFNFLPVPPLDGGEIVGYLLPADLRAHWMLLRRYAWIVFAVLLFTGVLERILDPILGATDFALKVAIEAVRRVAFGG